MNLNSPQINLLDNLKASWLHLYKKNEGFNYKLNITNAKRLSDIYKFYLMLNEDRVSKRRKPESVGSVNQEFTDNGFNFKNIHPKEILLVIPYETSEMTIIINNSPLTMFHSLIVPNLQEGLPQRITLDALIFSVNLLKSFPDNHSFRIGYNSPGAMASVNHLHLHLLEIDEDLYIDQAKLKFLGNVDIFRLDESMPTEAICCLIYPQDSKMDIFRKMNSLHIFLKRLCCANIPHNIFITPDRMNNWNGALKVFIFARSTFCPNKDLNDLRIGFCELVGYITVGDEALFDDLQELDVINLINHNSGDVYENIYRFFQEKQ